MTLIQRRNSVVFPVGRPLKSQPYRRWFDPGQVRLNTGTCLYNVFSPCCAWPLVIIGAITISTSKDHGDDMAEDCRKSHGDVMAEDCRKILLVTDSRH